jgi:hypothetical protein
MARLSGQTQLPTNVDVLFNAPFDARTWTETYAGLTDGTIPQPYLGMLVSVYADPDTSKNGVYFCTNLGGPGIVTTISTTWEKLGAGTGTLTGGTVSSDNKISGATTSGYTTYFGQVRAATGGTYSNGVISLSGTGLLGNITGLNVLSGSGVSGLSFNQSTYDLTITTNDNNTYTRNLSILSSDLRVTGGTYNSSNGIGTFTNNSGGTFQVSGFLTGYTDFYTTGSTYTPNTGIISFRRTDTQLAYSATGFNYVTGGSYNNGTLSLVTNTGQTISITGFSFSTTFTGGTVTGATNFTNGLTANTISATTYFNLPTDVRVTGGTFNNGTITFTNNTGGTFTVTGIASQFTGGTVTGSTNFTNGLTANTISATTYFNLPTDVRVTGGTYSSGTITFTNNTGGTFTVTGLNTSTTFTGGTVTGATNFTNGLTASTISATTYFNLPTDIKVTGGTYSSGTTTFTNNTGGTFTVTGFTHNSATGGTYSNGAISLSGTGQLGTITGFNVLSGSGVSGLSFNQATYDLTITTNNNSTYTRNLSILASDLRVTGGTYNSSNGIGTFVNNSGGTFQVSGFLTGYTDFYTTGSTYTPTTGVISFNRTDLQQAYSATGFNYVTGGTFDSGTLSLVTNTGQTVTINGFGTGSAVITGGTDNFITKWSGTSALTISQIFDNGTNVGIGVSGISVTNKLHISASTNPVRIENLSFSATPQETTKFLAVNDSGVMYYNNVTPFTGISIYTTAVTSNFGSNLEKPQIDFITTGGTTNYRGVSYQYLVTHSTLPTTRMGVLQGLWSTGGTSNISSSDTGPLQIDNGSSGVVYSLGFSAVTGGISVYLYAQGDGSPYTFKAYKVLL